MGATHDMGGGKASWGNLELDCRVKVTLSVRLFRFSMPHL
jgi:hypothetical protein